MKNRKLISYTQITNKIGLNLGLETFISITCMLFFFPVI